MPNVVTLPRSAQTPAERRGSTPSRDRHGRSTVRPDVDWTGHRYHSEAELTVDYTHRGRDVMYGPGRGRVEPFILGRGGFIAPTWTTKHGNK